MQITNNNLIRNGFKTHESRIIEVKNELIQNQNMQFGMLNKLWKSYCIIDKQVLVQTDDF